MLKRISVVLFALMLSVVLHASAQALGLGDAAPKIDVKEFVKGKPVKEFQKGKIYVVEFWATWCGPCKVSIPHLTEMAHKNKDVTFVGVSVWEQNQAQVKPFVTTMGDKMDYTVAMDNVPAGGQADAGYMAKNWMTAAAQNGIPTAFVVDKDSKIAWIGHPMAMEKPLAQIVAGKWDIKAAVAEADKAKAAQAKLQELNSKLRAANGDSAKMVAILDEAIQSNPDLEPQLAPAKFRFMLLDPANAEKAAAFGTHLVETLLKDDSEQLNAFAWGLVDPKAPKRSAPLVKLALTTALRADELTKGKDAAIADTLARAYFANGNTAKAVETQTRAVANSKGTELEKELTQTLAEYKKAANRL